MSPERSDPSSVSARPFDDAAAPHNGFVLVYVARC